MYKNCNTERTAKRQMEMTVCLYEAMKRQPYAEITVSDLCAQAGVSRKSFYRYFGNKDGCLCALIDLTLLEMNRYPIDEQDGSLLPQALRGFLSFWRENTDLLKILIDNHLMNVLIQRLLHFMQQEKPEFLRKPGGERVIDPTKLLFTLSGSIALVVNWYETEFAMTIQELVDLMCSLILG